MKKEQEGQVVQYVDGFAWGILPSGKTICLGQEAEIKTAISNPRIKLDNPSIAAVISLERRLASKEEDRKISENGKEEKRRKARVSKLRA